MSAYTFRRAHWGVAPPSVAFLNRGSRQSFGLVAWFPLNQLEFMSRARRGEGLTTINATPTFVSVSPFGKTWSGGSMSTPITGFADGLLDAYPVTTSIWFYRLGTAAFPAVIFNLRRSKNNWLGERGDDKLHMYTEGDSGSMSIFSATLPTKEWIHAVAVHASATDHKLYLNGILSGSSTTDTTVSLPWNRVVIGSRSSTPEYTGNALDARVYNRALTAAECYALYNPATRWELWSPPRRFFMPAFILKSYFYVDPVSGNDGTGAPDVDTQTPANPYQTVAAAITDMAAGSGTEQWLRIKGGTTVQEGTSGNHSIDLGTLSGASASARLHIDAYATGNATIDGQGDRVYGITGSGDFIEITNRITISDHQGAGAGEGFAVQMESGADGWDCEPEITSDNDGGYRINAGDHSVGGNATTSGNNGRDTCAVNPGAGHIIFKANARFIDLSSAQDSEDALQVNDGAGSVHFESGCEFSSDNLTKQVVTLKPAGDITGHIKIGTGVTNGTGMSGLFIRRATDVDLEVECLTRIDKPVTLQQITSTHAGISGDVHITGLLRQNTGQTLTANHCLTVSGDHPTTSTMFFNHITVGEGSGCFFFDDTNTVDLRDCAMNRNDPSPATNMRFMRVGNLVTFASDHNGMFGWAGDATNGVRVNATNYDSLAAYQAGEPTLDQDSRDDDPEMHDVGGGDFRLDDTSPWIEAGQVVAGGRYLDDAPYTGTPDIGAYGFPFLPVRTGSALDTSHQGDDTAAGGLLVSGTALDTSHQGDDAAVGELLVAGTALDTSHHGQDTAAGAVLDVRTGSALDVAHQGQDTAAGAVSVSGTALDQSHHGADLSAATVAVAGAVLELSHHGDDTAAGLVFSGAVVLDRSHQGADAAAGAVAVSGVGVDQGHQGDDAATGIVEPLAGGSALDIGHHGADAAAGAVTVSGVGVDQGHQGDDAATGIVEPLAGGSALDIGHQGADAAAGAVAVSGVGVDQGHQGADAATGIVVAAGTGTALDIGHQGADAAAGAVAVVGVVVDIGHHAQSFSTLGTPRSLSSSVGAKPAISARVTSGLRQTSNPTMDVLFISNRNALFADDVRDSFTGDPITGATVTAEVRDDQGSLITGTDIELLEVSPGDYRGELPETAFDAFTGGELVTATFDIQAAGDRAYYQRTMRVAVRT